MSQDSWIELAAVVFVGLVLLVVLWPLPANGRRLLKKWQVPEPTDAQVEEAVRYLKRRRLLYPWLYAGFGYLNPWGNDNGGIVVVVLVGTLVAELLALRPRRGTRREATLTPRGLFDIASKWVLGSYAVIVVGTAVHLGIGQRWDRVLWLGLSVVVVGVIIWAAVARPASGDQAVDLALRIRSVHVSAGLGAAVAGVLTAGWIGFIGILAWIALANTTPDREKIRR